MAHYYIIQSSVHIMNNHVFTFRKEYPGTIFVKEFSKSSTEIRFDLLQDISKAAEVSTSISGALINDAFLKTCSAISFATSKRHKNRK